MRKEADTRVRGSGIAMGVADHGRRAGHPAGPVVDLPCAAWKSHALADDDVHRKKIAKIAMATI